MKKGLVSTPNMGQKWSELPSRAGRSLSCVGSGSFRAERIGPTPIGPAADLLARAQQEALPQAPPSWWSGGVVVPRSQKK